MVDGRFCFEGGSRCNKGEGLHVLVSDQAEDVERAVRLAAQSKLFTRRRPVSRNMSGKCAAPATAPPPVYGPLSGGIPAQRVADVTALLPVMDSPSRKTSQSRSGTLSCADSVILAGVGDGSCCCSEECACPQDGDDFPYACSHRHSPFWPSAESSRVGADLDSNYGCGDTASVREMPDSVSQIHGDTWGLTLTDGLARGSGNRSAMERCTSCFSKLGAPAMSRSSTCTPGTPLAPAWPSEPVGSCCHHSHHHLHTSTTPRPKTANSSVCDRLSMSSHDGSDASEYSVPRMSCGSCAASAVSAPSSAQHCQCPPSRPPARPPKPCQDQTSPSKKKRKAPMPLPEEDQGKDKDYVVHACACHNPNLCLRLAEGDATLATQVGPYENYDIPRPLAAHLQEGSKSPAPSDPNQVLSLSALNGSAPSDEYYDTPKNVKECLSRVEDMTDQYGNYDTPPSAKAVCGLMLKCAKRTVVSQDGRTVLEDRLAGQPMGQPECPCQRVTCWPLAYCRKGNGVDNSAVVKVRLSGQGKMPVVNQRGQVELYATIDRSKKTNRRKSIKADDEDAKTDAEGEAPTSATDPLLNYENLAAIVEATDKGGARDVREAEPAACTNYANIQFAQSLELYENSRDVLQRAGLTPQAQAAVCGAGGQSRMCAKCGHCQSSPHAPTDSPRNGTESTEAEAQPNGRLDDYMMMEPNQQSPGPGPVASDPAARQNGPSGKNFPGYLPMSPITGPNVQPTALAAPPATSSNVVPPPVPATKSELMRMALDRLAAEKSASNPSLSQPGAAPFVDRAKKRVDSEFVRVPGSAMLAGSLGSPHLRRDMSHDQDGRRLQMLARRRSNSADSSRFLDDHEESGSSSRVSSVNSLLSQCELGPAEPDAEDADGLDEAEAGGMVRCHAAAAQDAELGDLAEPDSEPSASGVASGSGSSASIQTLVQEAGAGSGSAGSSSSSPSSGGVHIRRSSSVPCKGNNRDSSSSNDSGVSIGSLRHRAADLAELERFELPLTTALSSHWRAQRLAGSQGPCMHASLQRRSKSSDPLKEITFQFHRMSAHPKSSSAEAEVPVCPAKKGKCAPLPVCASRPKGGVVA